MRYVFVLAIFFLSSCSILCKWQTEYPDNFIEECLEDIIEDKTDTSLDLSPFTGEERQDDSLWKIEF